MLDWLGVAEGAFLIREAVRRALADDRVATRDIGGTLSTSQMTDAILASLPG